MNVAVLGCGAIGGTVAACLTRAGVAVTPITGSRAVAAAIEEQGAATREISRNVQQAATGTGEVSDTLGEVSGEADATGRRAHAVLEAASQLADQLVRLSHEVERYVSGVRAA